MRSYLLLTFLSVLMTTDAASQELKDYRWKNRILLLCEKDKDLVQSEKQVRAFKAFPKELEERKLVILVCRDGILMDKDFKILKNNADSPENKGFQGVLLIGLDGGVKWEGEFPVNPGKIFEIIDSMPMRRAEIKGPYDP
ncbi:DUF4174 domain-containing protein [Muriicola jejuensis]|uniref:DUF4174 domain-containing protein n=1 Tax=Muriicola jejuensis TaxID=504488 RepID=A0A6P0UCA7_9FLAO|nr:DUF4174 domain-containing protein [Muriicola jejuensis]NER09268.1 DUF4174 domain-containing protein [Muriicola jejuensis]